MNNTIEVASNKAPTATCATVETTIGNSGCTASCPQATLVINAVNPRQSCAISNDNMVIAERRTTSMFEYWDSARMDVQARMADTSPAFSTCGHQLMP